MIFEIEPIGVVEASRSETTDDFWGDTESVISLSADYDADSLAGLDQFSHVEIVFVFHHVDPAKVVSGARHPRNNTRWPATGIFSQRGKNRPNRLGTTICRVKSVAGTRLTVAELDAVDGTPVVDIKPVMAEFLPRTEVVQPDWCAELMQDYWRLNH